MSSTATDIETIVRIVLERMRAADAAPAEIAPLTHPISGEGRPATEKAGMETASATLRIAQKLVTLEQLRHKLADIRIVEVQRQAVVTPAVVDELKQRGVKLRRVALSTIGEASTDGARLLLVAPLTKAFAPAAVKVLAEPPDLEQTLAAIASHVSAAAHGATAQGAIWCTSRPFAAAMAAGQRAPIRAVQLACLSDLPRAVEQANPNVLILDDRAWTTAALANLTRMWRLSV